MTRAALFLALLLPGVAEAQEAVPAVPVVPCSTHQAVIEILTRHGETVQSIGLSDDGDGLVEMWANRATGSWTLVIVGADGSACVPIMGGMFSTAAQGDPA